MLIELLLFTTLMSGIPADGPAAILRDIYSKYLRVVHQPSVSGFVEIDARLREFMASRDQLSNPILPFGPDDTLAREHSGERIREDVLLMQTEYQLLGLYLDHYMDLLHYDGRFIDSAHALDPTSKMRNYTLYAEVQRNRPLATEEIAAALTYLHEYPDGPFAEQSLARIAGHYADAYVISRDSTAEWEACLSFYAGLVDTLARSHQMSILRRQAITFYEAALKKDPQDRVTQHLFSAFNRGDNTNALIYCSEE